ncbi:MAG TPA: hypothetical protein VN772_03730 [Solirubrobacteraceae bacterium]|nr:hypothetical protein [Solirubrobacteraceae bacterium]
MAFLLAGLLGAAAAVLPAVAGSETIPTVNALAESGEGIYKYPPRWLPERTAIAQPGTVTFTNGSSTVTHGIIWTSAAIPACESSVPVGAGNFKTSWSGTCTFAKPGEYTFYCSYHGPSMHGVIVVGAGGEVTTTSTSNTGTGQTPPPTTPTGPPQSPPAGNPVGAPGSQGSPFAHAAFKLAAGPHDRSVNGSVDVSSAGAGGRLEVDVLVRRAVLASTGASALTRVGRFVRPMVPAGPVAFKVALDARALHALHARGRLALTVRIALTPPGGAPAALPGRALLLRR